MESQTTIDIALENYIENEDMTLHGIVSRKPETNPTSIACVVSQASHEKGKTQHWILRISVWKRNHRTSQFVAAWRKPCRRFLPEMRPVVPFAFDGKNFIVEAYEYIGDPPKTACQDDTETLFRDLHSRFSRALALDSTEEYTELFTRAHDAILGYAELHRAQWYHLDISLENIVCDDDRTVLIDFEGALGLEEDEIFVDQTQVRASCKKDYAAPEIRGPIGSVTPGDVDVWAVAVMIYYLVCAELPFKPYLMEGDHAVPVDRWDLYEYVRKHGFAKFVRRCRPGEWGRLRRCKHVLDLLQKCFVVYTSNGFIYEHGEQRRLTMQEVADHRFFDKFRREEPQAAPVVPDDDRQINLVNVNICDF